LLSGAGSGELEILRVIRRRAGGVRSRALPVGIGDDCALIRPRAGEDLAVTTDFSVAGRHFRLEWHPAEAVGHRTLARGLSDLAAMGARPVAAFLSLGLPRDLTRRGRGAGRGSWLEGFLDGFLALARAHKTPLAGGDLAESPWAAADIVLIGAVTRGRALLRSGARPGDLIYVTGTLGGAAAGIAQLARLAESAGANHGRRLRVPARMAGELAPHFYPQPRLKQGHWLMRHRAATAAIDISDGLSTDLTHVCEESDVAAEIDAGALPIHRGASLGHALNGGEDYELLFTARASAWMPRAIAGVPVTPVGRILRRRKGRAQVTLLTGSGAQALEAGGWQHFASDGPAANGEAGRILTLNESHPREVRESGT
jgi:thiamine-monophosphate kinase